MVHIDNKEVKIEQIELWRDIGVVRGVNYTGYYQVSNKGRVRSLDRTTIAINGYTHHYKGKIFDQSKTHNGYLFVVFTISNGGMRIAVHRLVATAFIPNIFNKCCVNHIDSNPSNNNVENLEWVTMLENSAHAMEFGNINSILQKDIPDAIKLYKNGQSPRQIGKIYAVSPAVITRILKINNITIRSRSQARSIKFNYDKEKIISLYQSGLTLRKVAENVDISKSTVTKILEANNIKIRNFKEAVVARNANKKEI